MSGDIFRPGPTAWTSLTLCNSKGGLLLRISLRDGTLEYGPNYELDEAAKRFWEAVSEHAPRLRA